jgi:hypothetical protein
MWFVGGVCVGDAIRSTCLTWPAAVVFVGPAVVALLLILGALILDARRTVSPSDVAARANRHASLASVAGVALLAVVLAGALLTLALGARPVSGRTLALLPLVAGGLLLLVQAVGQVTWPKPRGAQREAELVSRAVREVVAPWGRRLMYGWAGMLLVALAVFAVVADGPRSLGRAGGAQPAYPGPYFGVPVAVGVVALVVGTELVLRLIVVRPAVVGVSPEWDLRLRRRCAGHVVRGVQLVLAVTLAGVLGAAGIAHLGPGAIMPWDAAPTSGRSAGEAYLGVGLLGAGLATGLAGIVACFAPTRRRRVATLHAEVVTT